MKNNTTATTEITGSILTTNLHVKDGDKFLIYVEKNGKIKAVEMTAHYRPRGRYAQQPSTPVMRALTMAAFIIEKRHHPRSDKEMFTPSRIRQLAVKALKKYNALTEEQQATLSNKGRISLEKVQQFVQNS